MNKHLRTAVCLLLLLTLLAAAAAPAFADGPAPRTLTVSTADELLALGESCVLDRFSQGLTVSLEADIDLSETDCPGIPIFSGTFSGNGHTISGLNLTREGSVQGFFRYLTAGAVVTDLHLEGEITPAGSRRQVGGIAGSNSGTIRGCSFRGCIRGTDRIGGIAGTNTVSGLIEDCRTEGCVTGNHFVGGVAGDNAGLIRRCSNEAGINTDSSDNDVSVSEITTDTIMGTESADTVTDLGGIAGTTSGVLRDCENHAVVGYRHMGYNVGGIAGSQTGLISGCRNYGAVYGRKEVAGIAGQMEPVSRVEFSADTLQILRGQLESTSSLADRASSNIQRSSRELSSQMGALHDQANSAMDAVRALLPSKETPHFPDADQIQAARNTLSSAVSSIQSTISSINRTTRDGVGTAASDIRAVTDQINAISDTLDSATEHLGGRVTDVSDQDTPDDLTGKVMACENFGPVSGDLNIGGIAGSVAWENDLDPEEDFQISGQESLNFDSELRAVILDSRNAAEITAKKRNAGGIVGNLSLGLVRGCVNTGTVDAEKAQYVGGIAGVSEGYLRSCSTRCVLRGSLAVGGIAGSAPIVSDCRSLTRLPGEGEQLGAVLGTVSEANESETEPIRGNFFLDANHIGAIDGISYAGVAEPLDLDRFLALDGLCPIFAQSHLYFIYEDGTVETILVPLGQALEQMPALPEKDGCIGSWEPSDPVDLEHICFDTSFTPAYTISRSVIGSDAFRPDGRSVLLAEGDFTGAGEIPLTALDALPAAAESETVLEGWTLPDFGGEQPQRFRIALPESLDPREAAVRILGSDGNWRDADCTANGSYLVFAAQPGDSALCLVEVPALEQARVLGLGGVLLAAAGILTAVLLHRRHRKKSSDTPDPS